MTTTCIMEDWALNGRTFRQLVGRRVLMVVANPAAHQGPLESVIAEASPSGAYFKVAERGKVAEHWLRAQDYRVIEVLPSRFPNERTHAHLWGLLGGDDVRELRRWFETYWWHLPAEGRERARRYFGKLAELDEARNAERGAGVKLRVNNKVTKEQSRRGL